MLVNNVGTSIGGDFEKYPEDKTYQDIININCLPIVFLTKRILPKLKNRYNKKNRSAIINISSIAG